jgi:hypothetical protein
MKGKKTGGRKKGTLNKATEAKLARIAKYEAGALKQGCEPLNIMLANMRWAFEEAHKESDPASALRLRTFAQTCASDAGPYLHSKLATITHKGDQDAPMVSRVEIVFVSPTRQNGLQ